ncbi:MAG TPA: hypothetical protein VKS78_14190 [Roseiarcus sp.]|nr:hypothetical protein [Roseiarcus sp.]
MEGTAGAWRLKLGGVALVCGLCGACSTVESVLPSSSTLANLVSFNSSTDNGGEPAAAPAGQSAAYENREIDCPQVEVQDGTSAMRVGGDANQSVRYQFDITQTARECKIIGNQFAIKVGVAGRLLIGPAGKPGAYSAPLRIAVRNDINNKAAVSKLYKVEATADPTSQRAPFQIVSEPLMLPYEHKWADQDYTILVGFDTVAAPAEKRQRKKHPN